MRRVIAAVLVVVAVDAAASAQDVKLPEIEFGRYHALVIGNNDYQNLPKLNTAVSDATATAKLLREKYGFDVKLLVDATRLDILRSLSLSSLAGGVWVCQDAACRAANGRAGVFRAGFGIRGFSRWVEPHDKPRGPGR